MKDILARIGLSAPIIQAAMAGVSTPAMAAAATNAGALGSIGVGAVNVEGACAMIEAVKALTSGPFNVNVFCHRPARSDPQREASWLSALSPVFERYGASPPPVIGEIYRSFVDDPAMLELFMDLRPAVVSFHFGLPSAATIGRLKSAGTILLASATSLGEAEAAVRAGVDAVVAQGFEAGGHRGVFNPAAPDAQTGLMALTRRLVMTIDAPVIAAGGLMDGAGIAAALRLGAAGAQLGTAFIGCPESAADASYRRALFDVGAASTVMTTIISGRPARCLPNLFTALTTRELVTLAPPDYPIAYDAGKSLSRAANIKGEGGFGAQWAGQGAPMARAMPVAELIEVLKAELSEADPKR